MKRKNPDAGRKHKKPPDAVEQGEGANEDDACGAEPAVDQKRQKGGRDEKARAVVGGNKAPTYRDSCRDCQVCLLLACGQGCGGCACECECRTRDARDGCVCSAFTGPACVRVCACAGRGPVLHAGSPELHSSRVRALRVQDGCAAVPATRMRATAISRQ